MQTNQALHGLGTALITPFATDGTVDYPALARLLDLQIAGGVDYLVVLGTTGESATLSTAEKIAVREFIVHHIDGRIPLVLGIGGNCTARVVEEIEFLSDLLCEQFVAILSVCPYYNKPSQEGLFQHFATLAEVAPIPILLYNVPGRTGVNLLPETALRLHAAYPNKICGIKEASGNIDQIERLIRQAPKAFLVISGDDGIAAPLMAKGAAGLISVASNAFPKDFSRLIHDGGNVATYAIADSIQERYEPMIHFLFAEGNPVGIKAVLAARGIIQNYIRLPLVPASEQLQEAIEQELNRLEQV